MPLIFIVLILVKTFLLYIIDFFDDLLSQFSTYLLVDISSFEIELNENNQLKEPLMANVKKIMTIIDLEYSILGIKAFTNHLKEILKSL